MFPMNYKGYCPSIRYDGREEIWFGRAVEILNKAGMLPDDTPEHRLLSEIRCLSLGRIYADFCAEAFEEYGSYYEDIRNPYPPETVKRLLTEYGEDARELFAGIEDAEEEFPDDPEAADYGAACRELANIDRWNIISALKSVWNDTLFFLGLYCTLYLPDDFRQDDDDDFDDYDDDEDTDSDVDASSDQRLTAEDFERGYWEYIDRHAPDLANEIYFYDPSGSGAAYAWVTEGCYTVNDWD